MQQSPRLLPRTLFLTPTVSTGAFRLTAKWDARMSD